MMRVRRSSSGWALLFAAMLAGGCAKQARPPGGPVDRTPPAVVGHRPVGDATEVPPDAVIAIDFTEVMDHQRTEEAVFLAPRSPIETGWQGRRLTIHVRSGLAEGRTYVVTVGTDARDLRGNRLPQSYSFAFATGARLDTGTVAGRAVDEAYDAVRSAFVWAYDMEHFDGRTAVDAPAYVTQSGADGTFRFERLASSRYRVVAFRDGNRNQAPDAGEALGLPSTDIVAGATGASGGGVLVLAERGREPRVQRVTAVDRNHLLLVFEEDIDAASVDVDLGPLKVRGLYADPLDGQRLHVITDDQVPGRTYRPQVRLEGRSVPTPEEPVRGTDRKDTRPPAIVSTSPAQPQVDVDSLVIRFSEAMDTTVTPRARDWVITDSAAADVAAAPAGTWAWGDAVSLVFTPEAALTTGAPLHLAVRLAALRDRAGNAPADSVAVFDFEVLTAAESASVTGTAQFVGETGPVRVRLVAAAGDVLESEPDSSGAYGFARLAPGAYTLSAFVDRDGNGRHGLGQLEPYGAAEPLAVHGALTLERGQTATVDLPAGESAAAAQDTP